MASPSADEAPGKRGQSRLSSRFAFPPFRATELACVYGSSSLGGEALRKTNTSFTGKRLLLVACSLVMLGALASAINWERLLEAFRHVSPVPLLFAFLLTLLFPLLGTLRWLAVLRALGVRIEAGRAFEVVMACQPVGNLTPGKAGDFLKATAVHSNTLGLGSVLAERVIDVAVLGVFGVTFGLIAGSWLAVAGGLVGIGGAATIILGARLIARLIAGRPIAIKLEGFLKVFPRLASRPRLLTACVLSSALNWFLSMVQLWFLLDAFGARAPLTFVIAILPAATFSGLLPIPTFAGAGPRDAALLYLSVGIIDPAAMLASSIMYTFFGYFLLGLAGLPFLGALTRGHDRAHSASHEGSSLPP